MNLLSPSRKLQCCNFNFLGTKFQIEKFKKFQHKQQKRFLSKKNNASITSMKVLGKFEEISFTKPSVKSLVAINCIHSISTILEEQKNDSRNNEEDIKKKFRMQEAEVVSNINKYCWRTHTCGELGKNHIGQKVCIMGWLEFTRMNKFALLRDAYGRTQLLVPDSRNDIQEILSKVTLESVLLAEGVVCPRPPGMENKKQKTGAIEVLLSDLKVLNLSKILPFYVREFRKPQEQNRMRYRYLDLRHDDLQKNLRLRSKTLHKMRRFLIEHLDFVEVETPTLFKRTPGGAQEFIVPTVTEGKFYSLVQSPQQFKQLLMIGSVDRYFQVARCYRDEHIRSDRQPEFTQLDIEMSFCQREDIMSLVEDLLKFCWPEHLPSPKIPFQRMSFLEAFHSYGTDKPDLRFDWKLKKLTDSFRGDSSCKGKYNIAKFSALDDFAVYGFVGRKGGLKFSDSDKKNLRCQMEIEYPNTGFLFISVKSRNAVKETLGTLFSPIIAEEIEDITHYEEDDVLFIAMGTWNSVMKSLGQIRVHYADYLEEKKIDVKRDEFNFLWVVDFPLFELKDNLLNSSHHPFTQPHPDDIDLLEKAPLSVKGLHFDLVLNGNEIGGGSIRIKDAALQKMILEKILKIDSSSVSHLLEGLESGAPPHGGIALGLDRIMALICGTKSIRDVMAFPKGGGGIDVMSGAPGDISKDEKLRYHIKIKD